MARVSKIKNIYLATKSFRALPHFLAVLRGETRIVFMCKAWAARAARAATQCAWIGRRWTPDVSEDAGEATLAWLDTLRFLLAKRTV